MRQCLYPRHVLLPTILFIGGQYNSAVAHNSLSLQKSDIIYVNKIWLPGGYAYLFCLVKNMETIIQFEKDNTTTYIVIQFLYLQYYYKIIIHEVWLISYKTKYIIFQNIILSWVNHYINIFPIFSLNCHANYRHELILHYKSE